MVSGLWWRTTSRPLPPRHAGKLFLQQAGSAGPPVHPWSTPLSGRDPDQYLLAGVLLAIGILLWLVNRLFVGKVEFDPAKLSPE